MKKIIISLGFLVVILVAVVGGVGVYAQKYSLYNVQERVKYDEILDGDTPTIYYYYQDTCHYCNNIKPQVKEFASLINETPGIEFKVVDMKDPDNTEAWYDWEAHDKKYGENTSPTLNPDYKSEASEMKTINDVKITGTPSAVYVKDGEIVDYEAGKDIFKTFKQVKSEFNIDYTFDESQYNKS